jgi:arginyl-tRNA synthetase
MIQDEIVNIISKVAEIPSDRIQLEKPELSDHGDYSTNIALSGYKNSDCSTAKEYAEFLCQKLSKDNKLQMYVSKVEVAGPGFINFWLSEEYLLKNLGDILQQKGEYGKIETQKGKKIMVEFAHPNTHKELHIGHMRTLILGEAVSRVLEASGALVFRANYQGDIGPHVAKAIWGTRKILEEKNMSWEETEKLSLKEKAHLLGEGYVKGVTDYDDEKMKPLIDDLNTNIYKKDPSVWSDYERTRRWSLEYYDTFYSRFLTRFDKLYFESEVGEPGKKIVLDSIGKVFEKSEGAVIFDGEKYGLHKRVFVTKDGNPTYEAKDMALAPMQYSDFPFDLNIHVVANEQKGYFQVMIKALELLDPKFEGREFHLPMGMVQLVGKKMSSRTGEIVTVDDLLEEIKTHVKKLVEKNIKGEEAEEISEIVTIGAVKYWMLKTNPEMDILFDLEKSVALDGNSGPYLQYTHARCKSVLRKAESVTRNLKLTNVKLNNNEINLLRSFAQFHGVISGVCKMYSINLLCNYLYDVAQKYNAFYNSNKIIGSDAQNFRLSLTTATAQVLENGLETLGIMTPNKM